MKILKPFATKFSVFLIALFTFSILVSCESCQRTHHETNGITQKDIDIMKENHIIPLKEAVKAYDKYSKDRIKILKDTLKKKYKDANFNDTRNVWVDITTIKAYLKYIEQESKDSIEGLAFYFSVNLDSKEAKKNHQTFFIAPTQKNGDIQSGFTIVDGKTKFLYEAFEEHDDSRDQNIQKGSFFSLMQSEDGFLFNRTDPNPPGNNN